MDALRQDDVFSCVMALWPRCRLTKPEFAAGAWLRLRGYSVDLVLGALKRHRALYLDAIRPEWKTLFRELASDGEDDRGRNNFQVLLANIRRWMSKNGWKHVDDMSDGEIFQGHLDANPGKRAGIVNGWREYFADRGEPPPGFLTE